MSAVIVWFRRDLRLADNPALHHAFASGATVIPAYIHAPEEEAPWEPGGASRWWLHHSLTALAAALRAKGGALVVRGGPALPALLSLAEETGATRIVWNRLYDPAIVARDRLIKDALRARGIASESYGANLLFEPWTIRTRSGGPYRVFTPFWNACQQLGLNTEILPAPQRIAAPDSIPSSSIRLFAGHGEHDLDSSAARIAELNLAPNHPWADSLAEHWKPGEAAALARLERFAETRMEDYPAQRDRPDLDGVSRLSAHLHFGEVSPRQVIAALQRAAALGGPGAQAAAETVMRQLGWREFAHHVLYHFPHTTDAPLDARYARFPWRDEPALLHAWQRARTGVPMVDAAMRELWATGWMHNRARMIVASFLTKHLRLPWQAGARWFWDTLVDADLAQNGFNWQWCAGCGADAAPYFRIFNPVRQGQHFDPDGKYVRRWLPELKNLAQRWVHVPWTAPASVLHEAGTVIGRDYPPPLVDLKKAREEALAAYRQYIGMAAAGLD